MSDGKTPRLVAPGDLPRLPQQQRSRLLRDELLDAGLALFSERGYEAASVEEIAQRAGTGVGSVYAYFRGKRQLLLVLMERYLEELDALGLDRIEFGPDPLPALEEAIRRGFGSERAYAGLYRAWREATPGDPELAAHDRRVEEWMVGWVASAIDRAARGVATRPGADSASIAAVLVAVSWSLAQNPPEDEEAIVRALARMIYHAVFPDRS